MPEIFHAPSARVSNKKRSNGTSLSAFMVEPIGVRFQTQSKTENILLLMRRHPITNLGWVLVTLILFLIPGFFLPFLVTASLIPPGTPPGYFVILPLLWYLGTFGYAFTNFLHWYYNIYIVTNERVVDVDWISLLYKQLSSTQIERIQDVTYNQGGILDAFFDFGNVLIQTAGSEPNFEFDAVPKPNVVVKQINDLLEKKGVKASP